MPNLLDKAIRATAKGHKIKKRLLMPKGRTAYILKRSGRTSRWVILAIFENFGVDIDRFRNADYFEFAPAITATFSDSGTAMTMNQVAQIATHIATVDADGFSVVHGIQNGDEDKPQQMQFSWRFYTRQMGDTFDPENL